MELCIRRRGFRRRGPSASGDKKQKERYFLLDEALGLPSEERFCPLVQQLGMMRAPEQSFRGAEGLLHSVCGVPVSH